MDAELYRFRKKLEAKIEKLRKKNYGTDKEYLYL